MSYLQKALERISPMGKGIAMKKMKMTDLTLEIMKGLEGMKTTQEMKEYCLKEGYDLSDELAERIMAQFERDGKLSDDEAAAAAGGIIADVKIPHGIIL